MGEGDKEGRTRPQLTFLISPEKETSYLMWDLRAVLWNVAPAWCGTCLSLCEQMDLELNHFRSSLLSAELNTTSPPTALLLGIKGRKSLLASAPIIPMTQEKPRILSASTDH